MPLASALGLVASLATSVDARAAACPLFAPRAAKEYEIPGTSYMARDPYGGLLARRAERDFTFSVGGPSADLARLAAVRWALGGTAVSDDSRAPFRWNGSTIDRIPAGRHTITVTVLPAAGAPASVSFKLTATDCQEATFTADVAQRQGPASLEWDAA